MKLKERKIQVLAIGGPWNERRKHLYLSDASVIIKREEGSVIGRSGLFFIKDGNERCFLLEDTNTKECIFFNSIFYYGSSLRKVTYVSLQQHEIKALKMLANNKLFANVADTFLSNDRIQNICRTKSDRFYKVQCQKRCRKINKFFLEK